MFSAESPSLLQPIATSTPAHAIEYQPPPQEIADNENHVPTNPVIVLMSSKVNNEAHANMRLNEPINVLPAGVASNDIR